MIVNVQISIMDRSYSFMAGVRASYPKRVVGNGIDADFMSRNLGLGTGGSESIRGASALSVPTFLVWRSSAKARLGFCQYPSIENLASRDME